MPFDLVPLLEPRSIAVIGASDRGDKPGARLARLLAGGAFAGRVVGVNPRRVALEGVEWLADLDELDAPVDLACIAVGAEAAVRSLGQLTERRLARAVIVYSSGFAEAGAEGAALEQRLVDLAVDGEVALCGPNTAGIISLTRSFVGSFTHAIADGLPPLGSTMVITQSGAVGGILLTRLRDLGVGISHWVSVGNGAVLSVTDYLRFAAEDPATDSVVLFLEGLDDGPAFRAAVEACTRNGMAVTVYKTGTTAAGAAAARSHTGKMAGSDRVYEGLFRQLSVRRARTLDELAHLGMAAAWWPPARGDRAALVSVSGAGCTILADEASRAGLPLARFADETRDRLAGLVPDYAQQANPVDLTGSVLEDLDRLRGVIRALVADAGVELVALAFATNTDPAIASAVADAWDRSKPLAVVLPVSDHASRDMRRVFAASRVPVFGDFATAAQALRAAVQAVPVTPAVPREAAAGEDAAADSNGAWLPWPEAAALLEQAGIAVAHTERADSAAQAAAIVRRWGVPRVVVKLDHPAALHKSDVGGVAVGVAPSEVEGVCAAMAARLEAIGHDLAPHGGFLVQEQVAGVVEALVGLTHDPTFGPTVTVGVGGTAVEAWQEVASLVPPFSDEDLRQAVRATKLAALFDGARGVKLDLEDFIDLVRRFDQLAAGPAGLGEVDLNPVMITSQGCVVVDARMRLADTDGKT